MRFDSVRIVAILQASPVYHSLIQTSSNGDKRVTGHLALNELDPTESGGPVLAMPACLATGLKPTAFADLALAKRQAAGTLMCYHAGADRDMAAPSGAAFRLRHPVVPMLIADSGRGHAAQEAIPLRWMTVSMV